MKDLTPKMIVEALDKYIVGQQAAKKTVAIALRNRWRWMQLPQALREDVIPKNILMIGMTGVGKTEIARRLAKIIEAPFIKVEATKFTQVGYVGKDVDQIIRDLVEVAIRNLRKRKSEGMQEELNHLVEQKILDFMLTTSASSETRAVFLDKLKQGSLEQETIEITLKDRKTSDFDNKGLGIDIIDFRELMDKVTPTKTKTKKVTIQEARKLIVQDLIEDKLNNEDLKVQAIEEVEQKGIVFIDEIDKIASRGRTEGADIGREGVQRDLLPLIEGTTIQTKYGPVKTDHILFIGSGAFQLNKPTDLLPEIQGRLPIRVQLDSLTEEDFYAILTQTKHNLIEQSKALLLTEGLVLNITEEAIRMIAKIAFMMNDKTENIGARRLHAIIEKLLETISYEAPYENTQMTLDEAYVKERFKDIEGREDHYAYIL